MSFEKALVLVAGVKRQIANANTLDVGAGFTATASVVTPYSLGESGYWTKLANGHPMFTDALGVDHDLQP